MKYSQFWGVLLYVFWSNACISSVSAFSASSKIRIELGASSSKISERIFDASLVSRQQKIAYRVKGESSILRLTKYKKTRLLCTTDSEAENNDEKKRIINEDKEVDVYTNTELDVDGTLSSWTRLISALPKINRRGLGDELDKRILATAVPSMMNMAVVPIVNSVDTFWVGRLGMALALAGQAAANQAFFTLYFLVAFLPTITAPLVATAVGSGDTEAAQSRVCESLFLSNLLGSLGTLLLVGFPQTSLSLVLAKDAPAMEFAIPYLRLRALSMVPALFSATGFAAYRGLLNTVTPLKVSLATNIFNLITDPLLIFGLPVGCGGTVGATLKLGKGIGVAGAALATAGAEFMSGLIYLRLLLRRKLIRWSRLLKAPSWKNLLPLIQGGLAMLGRQLTLNLAFLSAARRAQALDPSGVTAAAYGIVMQIYSVGVVMHLGIQSTAATLVPSARATGGDNAARDVADRIFLWGSIIGIVLATSQLAALPYLVPIFSTLPEVQEAVKVPALISSFIHLLNGPVFAGEGIMLGNGTFKALASTTAIGVTIMMACLATPLGQQLNGILLSLAAFHLFQSIAVLFHHVRMGPLRRRNIFTKMNYVAGSSDAAAS